MGIPSEDILVKSLGASKAQNKITNIKLFGSSEKKIKWNQEADYLTIEKPEIIPNKIAVVFKVYLE